MRLHLHLAIVIIIIMPLYTMFLKLIKNYAGEGCGQGTLNNLQTALKDQVPNIAYDCFDVFGDPTNSAEVQGLTNCTADIITSIQKGTEFLQNVWKIAHHNNYTMTFLTYTCMHSCINSTIHAHVSTAL